MDSPPLILPSSIGDALDQYRRKCSQVAETGKAVEFEIKFRGADYLFFHSVLESIKTYEFVGFTESLDMSIDLPSQRKFLDASDRRTTIYRDGKKVDMLTIHKRKLYVTHPIRLGNKISIVAAVAMEENISNFDPNAVTHIRGKIRLSFNLSPEWRLDMTIVKKIDATQTQHIKESVQALLKHPPLTLENFESVLKLDKPEIQEVYSYEVEIEHIGRAAIKSDVDAIVDLVTQNVLVNVSHAMAMQREIFDIAKKLVRPERYAAQFEHQFEFKKLSPPIRTITKSDYFEIFPPVGYYITDKIDGYHGMISIHNGNCAVISQTQYIIFPFDSPNCIFDGEIIFGEHIDFYVFDVCIINGKHIANEPFSTRITFIDAAVEVLRKMQPNIVAYAKKYVCLGQPKQLREQFDQIHLAEHTYETDGIIINAPDTTWQGSIIYKWKPLAQSTIDFCIREAPKTVLGRAPFLKRDGYKMYFLFVGIGMEAFQQNNLNYCPGYRDIFGKMAFKNAQYFPFQFQMPDNPYSYVCYLADQTLDNQIVEMRRIPGAPEYLNWEVVKVRDDRTDLLKAGKFFGNRYDIAEDVWLNYIDEFTYEELHNGPSDQYFMSVKDLKYKAQTGFMSFMKTQIINRFNNSDWIIDLGAGKGQSLGKMMDIQLNHLICVDIDKAAIAELLKRKYTHTARRKKLGKPIHPMTIQALVTDLKLPYQVNVQKLKQFGYPQDGVNHIIMDFMFHYFAGTSESLRNIVSLCENLIAPSGFVTMSIMLGNKVHELLIENAIKVGDSLDFIENEAVKYSIRRDYVSDTVQAVGQQIGVIHPFSGGKYYVEFLSNPATIVKEFTSHGFMAKEMIEFGRHIENFGKHNSTLHGALTDADKKYISLYGILLFQKR